MSCHADGSIHECEFDRGNGRLLTFNPSQAAKNYERSVLAKNEGRSRDNVLAAVGHRSAGKPGIDLLLPRQRCCLRSRQHQYSPRRPFRSRGYSPSTIRTRSPPVSDALEGLDTRMMAIGVASRRNAIQGRRAEIKSAHSRSQLQRRSPDLPNQRGQSLFIKKRSCNVRPPQDCRRPTWVRRTRLDHGLSCRLRSRAERQLRGRLPAGWSQRLPWREPG
jgi:hypothetical protein